MTLLRGAGVRINMQQAGVVVSVANAAAAASTSMCSPRNFSIPSRCAKAPAPTSTKARWVKRSTCKSGRPFDYKGATAVFSAKERYNDMSGKVDGKFGALLPGAYSKRRVYEEGLIVILYALRHSQTTNLSGVNGKLRKRFPVAL